MCKIFKIILFIHNLEQAEIVIYQHVIFLSDMAFPSLIQCVILTLSAVFLLHFLFFLINK